MTGQRKSRRRKSQVNETGSSINGPVFIAIGRLRRPHGVKGEIMMEVMTDFPERLQDRRVVYVGRDYQPMTISGSRPHQNGFLLQFDGISSRDEISEFSNDYICVPADTLPPLEDGEYYFHQLIGLSVCDEALNVLGTLTEIFETGANNVYLVQNDDGSEVLLPAIDSVVLNVRIDEKQMIVRQPEYL
jgi:16S rRNA processing protein RimM